MAVLAHITGALVSALFFTRLTLAIAGVRVSTARQVVVAYGVYALAAVSILGAGLDGGPPDFSLAPFTLIGVAVAVALELLGLSWSGSIPAPQGLCDGLGAQLHISGPHKNQLVRGVYSL